MLLAKTDKARTAILQRDPGLSAQERHILIVSDGQRTLKCNAPRRSSMWMGSGTTGVVSTWRTDSARVVGTGAASSIGKNRAPAASKA